MKKILMIMLILMSGFFSVTAQDVLYKKDKQEIKAKVTEIGIDEIKYKLYGLEESPVISILKSDLWKIKFSNGEEMLFLKDPYDVSQDEEIRNKTRAIKFEFFSPLTGDITFGYEQMIKVGTNFEGKLGIIGPGTNPDRPKAAGAFAKAGVKFLKRSAYVTRGLKFSHALRGTYIKPEIIFSHFVLKDYRAPSYNFWGPLPQTQDVKVTHIAGEMIFGQQFILGQTLTLDYYFGVGYGYMQHNYKNSGGSFILDSETDFYYGYGHMFTGKKTPLSFSTGMTLGVLF